MSTQAHEKFKVLLVGDECLDVYQYGTVDRISPEAPVPVFKYSYQESRRGMAGNVLENLQALGCKVEYVTAPQSCIKTRLIDIRSKQQIVRIDNDIIATPVDIDSINFSGFKAVVISDYNKGAVTYEFVQEARNRFMGPIFLDTKKKDLAKFNGVYVKVNEAEWKASQTANDRLIVTLGSKGAIYKTGKSGGDRYYPTPVVEVADVCGAGDTFLAALTHQYMVSGDIDKAIQFANMAASITVQHIGNYAPKLEEIQCQQG